MIPKEKLQEFKKRLEEGKETLMKKIKHFSEDVPDLGSDKDYEEEADKTEAFTDQLAGVLPLKEREGDVESALRKMEAGTYGICEKCGEEIDLETLEIDPESRLCRKDKKNA